MTKKELLNELKNLSDNYEIVIGLNDITDIKSIIEVVNKPNDKMGILLINTPINHNLN
jgi:hypothetical protein